MPKSRVKRAKQVDRKTAVAPSRSRLAGVSLGLLIVAAGVIAYSNSLSGAFVLDDRRNIQDSLEIRSLLPSRSSLLGPPWTTYTGRPVAMFSLALSYRIHGTRVEGYHIFNIAVHVLAGLTLWGIMRRTLRLPTFQRRFEGSEDLLATIIALIWVVHPLTTSAVTYMSQRAESLMGLFYLLTLYCFIRGASGRKVWYAVTVTFCLLGMGTKEPMVSAPLMVLLYDRTLIAGSFVDAIRSRRWVYLALAGTWVPLAILLSMHPHGGDVGFNVGALSGLDYLKTQAKVIVTYLKLCIWPSPLILYYGWADHDVPVLRTFPQYAPWGIMILVLLALTGYGLYRRSAGALAGAWFFLILGPSSTVLAMPTEMMAEYRMYLPLMAVIAAVVLGAHALGTKLLSGGIASASLVKTGGGVLAAGIAVTLAILTFRHNESYSTELGVWKDIVRNMPRNSSALGNIGLLEYHAGRYTEAEQHLDEALSINPKLGIALALKGLVLERSGKLTEAVEQLRAACEAAPRSANYRLHLARLLVVNGRQGEAISVLMAAVRQLQWEQPLYAALGAMLVSSGRREAGQTYLDRAIQLDPDPAHAHALIGESLAQWGVADLALDHLRQAAALSSRDPRTFIALGMVLSGAGQYAQAGEYYRHALKLAPNNEIALNNLAWIEATAPDETARDGNQAVRNAERLNQLSQRENATYLDTLAAAYAAAGQFEKARRTAEEALRLAGDKAFDPLINDVKARLELYRSGQPYRDAVASPSNTQR